MSAIDLFVAGAWANRSEKFTIAVQAALRSPDVRLEIAQRVPRLKAIGIDFLLSMVKS